MTPDEQKKYNLARSNLHRANQRIRDLEVIVAISSPPDVGSGYNMLAYAHWRQVHDECVSKLNAIKKRMDKHKEKNK